MAPSPPHSIDAGVDNQHLTGNFANYMSRIVNRMNLRLLEVLRPHNLTNSHYRIIQLLYDGDRITIGELSKRVAIPQAVLSRVLTQMEKRKLIRRRANAKDSRFKEIFLTDRGRQAYVEIWPEARKILDTAFVGLEPAEQETLLALLRKLDTSTTPSP